MDTEQQIEWWATIPGFGGHYEASSCGNIRVKDRVVVKPHSRTGSPVSCVYKGRLLKPTLDNKGYSSVHIGVDGEKTSLRVNRAVLLAFVGPPLPGHESCHNNGCSSDNRLSNLRWDTHHNNNQDRKKHGTYARGAAHPMAKLTDKQALEIYCSKELGRVLSEKYGIAESKISAIRLGRTWASVTGHERKA